MKIRQFDQFLSHVVAPLFSGANVSTGPKKPERAKASLVAYLPGGTVLRLRESTKATQVYEISRQQPFDDSEKRLVESLVVSYSDVKKEAGDYVDELADYIVRRGIARSVAPSNQKQQTTVATLLEKLTEWSAQTYEGERVSCGILVGGKTAREKNLKSFIELMAEDFTKALSDGVESWWTVDAVGDLREFTTDEGLNQRERGFFPARYRALAAEARSGRVGLTVSRNGEILVFSNNELRFAKRRGMWLHFAHEAIIRQMSGGGAGSKALREAIYESCLDASFSRSGACIGLLRKGDASQFVSKKLVAPEDVLTDASSPKPVTASVLIANRKFNEVPRLVRKELVSLDGAIVLNADGGFYAAGAILELQNVKRGNQGGRSAAAKALSRYGLGVKVSEDGLISGYKKESGDDEPFFKVG